MRRILTVLLVAAGWVATANAATKAVTKPAFCAGNVVLTPNPDGTFQGQYETFPWAATGCTVPTGPLYWFVERCDTTSTTYHCFAFPFSADVDPQRISFDPKDDGLYLVSAVWYSAGWNGMAYLRRGPRPN